MNKNILFISSRLPYPPIGGDRLKNFWLLKILSKHFKVHLVSITEKKIPSEFYEWADEIGITYKIFRKPKKNFIMNASKFIFNKLPIQVNYYYFKDVQSYINTIYHKYTLLFATLIRTAQYVIDKDKPKILDMADLISLNYENAKLKSRSLFWKFVYNLESSRLRNYEIFCVRNFNKTLLFNKQEVNLLRHLSGLQDSVVWIPHGVDESLFFYEKVNLKYKNYIVFFGKMDYQPNIDAVLWFIENVLPLLNKNLKFVVVGANATRKINSLEKKYPNVIVTGFVEDPYEIIKSSLCVVAPMQTGGGIQNKILESMALGTINIVSSLAAKAIGGEDKKHYFIIDDPKKMAWLINNIYLYPNKYDHIKANARNFIKNNFSWSIYEKKLLEIIEEVLK